MKETNTYATNKGGVIKAPKNPSANDPKPEKLKGDDLRTGKGNNGKG